MSGQSKPGRIAELDGLRGVAILWVLLYHFAYYWAPAGDADIPYLPYGDVLSWIPLASVGELGVGLFFLISGQVIVMTLERTEGFVSFGVKRMARLWPTMLICATLTFALSSLFGPPGLQVSFPEFLFSLFFLPPEHVGAALGQEGWQWLDGAYWSLWVEVRFYFIIGLIYFLFRKSWFAIWVGFILLTMAMMVISLTTGNVPIDRIGSLMIYEYAPWFLLGMLAHLRHRPEIQKWHWPLVAVGLIGVVLVSIKPILAGRYDQLTYWSGVVIVFALYYSALYQFPMTRWLAWTPMVKVGRASYSLYLMHQVAGLVILGLIGQAFGPTASLIALVPMIAIMMVLSRLVFHYWEQPANNWVVSAILGNQKKPKPAEAPAQT